MALQGAPRRFTPGLLLRLQRSQLLSVAGSPKPFDYQRLLFIEFPLVDAVSAFVACPVGAPDGVGGVRAAMLLEALVCFFYLAPVVVKGGRVRSVAQGTGDFVEW